MLAAYHRQTKRSRTNRGKAIMITSITSRSGLNMVGPASPAPTVLESLKGRGNPITQESMPQHPDSAWTAQLPVSAEMPMIFPEGRRVDMATRLRMDVEDSPYSFIAAPGPEYSRAPPAQALAGRRRFLRRQPGPNFDPFYRGVGNRNYGKASAQRRLSGWTVLVLPLACPGERKPAKHRRPS